MANEKPTTAVAKVDAAPDWLAEELGAEYQAAIRENLEGETRAVPIIRILHGNELFKMPDGSAVPEVTSVILFKHHVRTYWVDKENKEKRPPDCASIDAKVGTLPRQGAEFGECKTCIHAILKKKEGGGVSAAECTEKVRMLIYMEGAVLPYVLLGNTRSIGAIRDYMMVLASKGIPYFCINTTFKLAHAARGDQQWSELTLTNAGPIERSMLANIKKMRAQVEERARAAGVEDVAREAAASETTVEVQGTPQAAPGTQEDF